MPNIKKILKGARVLCVDDSPDALEFLRIVLARHGALVTTAISAEQAIAILKNERFDVLVSDLAMPPGLGGYDLAHALREMEHQDPTRHATPAVTVSGDALVPSRKRRFADYQVYMPKPFNSVRLVYVVDRLREADSEAVKLGSLGLWEAKEAVEAAEVATKVAATATAAAAEATHAAVEATLAAAVASMAAAKGSAAAALAEKSAMSAGAKARK